VQVSVIVSTALAGISLGGIFVLIALGMVLVYRATAVLNFAHGEFMLLAAFLLAEWQAKRLPGVLALVSSIGVVALIGAVFYQAALRRTVGLPDFVGVIATLGLASVLDGVMGIAFGASSYSISLAWLPQNSVSALGAKLPAGQIIAAGISLILAGVIAVGLRYTHVGIQMRAAGQSPLLASQSGISVHRIYVWSWAVAGGLAGVAGIVYGAINSVDTSIENVALLIFPAVILGGLDSVIGAIVGGIAVGLLQSFTTTYLGGQYVDLVSYGLLVPVLLYLPHGLFGTRRVVRA
jgi:branched-chain amino acid transport system permease protein